MKRLLLGGMLLVSCACSGQELSSLRVVGPAKHLSDELLDRSVKDANGQICAGLQIVSDLDGVVYEANNGVVKLNHLPGKDLLFLQAGERVVSAMKSGFKPLKIVLTENGIRLKTGEVWQIELTGDKKVDSIGVNFEIYPPDAAVSIDGINKGPATNLLLSIGRHGMQITRQGYRSISEQIDVSASNTLVKRTMNEVEMQVVNVQSVPTGAKITVDGLEKGETDKGVFLFPGTYRLKLSKSGYSDKEQVVDVHEGTKNAVSVILEKTSGMLKLTLTPPDARILINKEDFSGRNQIDLPPGRYKIEISKQGYIGASELVDMVRGDTVAKTFTLAARTGSLQVSVQPLDAHIALKKDGKVITEWNGPKILKSVVIGEYDIAVARSGYQEVFKRVRIDEGKRDSVDIVMQAAPTSKREDSMEGLAPDGMVFVEGGSFEMGNRRGDDDEKPAHRVNVKSVFMDRNLVTVAQYRRFCAESGRQFPGAPEWGWEEDDPVVNVTWDDASAYALWAHKRLPSEAEWEYAARGGAQTRGFTYGGSNSLGEVGWYEDNSGGRVHAVGQKAPNELGLYDMSGNVWEFCGDWYGDKYYERSRTDNPVGPSSGQFRVLRGGAWKSFGDYCSTTHRFKIKPDAAFNTIGFRCVQDVK